MPTATPYILIASMDVDPEYEDLFNEVYDDEHVAHLLAVPGVRNVERYKGVAAEIAIAGGTQQLALPRPQYTAIYEIDDPSVLASPEWAKAVEVGRWATQLKTFAKMQET